jgi:dolichyl-diphosphooligosaccharide--protein glycosyltransferase
LSPKAPGRAALLALSLFAAAFLVRIVSYGFVFAEGRVRFPSGNDELYHVRRIVYQVARFPEVLDFDRYVSFPFGARPVWPPFLDWLLALLVRPFAGGGDALSVERLIVWVPPLLGAVTVAVIGEIGRRHFSWLAGIAAGSLMAVMPAHRVHSQLGQVDHQVVVDLGAALLLATAMALLSSPDPQRSCRRLAPLLGLVTAASLLVSPGALLQILPLQAGLAAWVLFGADRPLAVARARASACVHGVAALLVLPACLGNGAFAGLSELSPLVLSNFQPLWLGAGTASFLAVAELWRRSSAGATRRVRVASAVALAAVGVALAVVGIPGLWQTLSHAGGWFRRDEAFLTSVIELRPLLFPADRFDPSPALSSLTLALAVFPLAWLWLAVRSARDREARPALSLLLVWSGVAFVLALAQERFANAFALGLAATLGAALEELRGIARDRFPRPAQWAFAVAVAALGAAMLAPASSRYLSLFEYSRFARAQAQPWIPPASRRKVVVEEAARWLRDASPPTRGFLDASLPPEYGVLTSWDDGHLVRYRAERPTVQDNFGSFVDRRAYEGARSYFDAVDEELAYRVAQELGARYAFATLQGSGQTRWPSPRSMAARMWQLLGNAGSGAPALARHRLVWVRDLSGQPRGMFSLTRDRVAIFEIVAGAWIEGEAAPGATVRFELALAAGGGRLPPYLAQTVASADGRYALRLPYPTDEPDRAEVRTAGAYRVRSGARSAELALHEADVRAGATVRGPSLR